MNEVQEVFKESIWNAATHIFIPMLIGVGVLAAIFILIRTVLDKQMDKLIKKIKQRKIDRRNNK